MKNIIKNQVLLIMIISFITSLNVFSAIEVIFYKGRGFTLVEIYSFFSILSIAVTVLEVPAGIISDYLGKKISLLMSYFIFFLGFSILITQASYISAAAAYILLGLGLSLQSGTVSSFLFQTLKQQKSENSYSKMLGRMMAMGLYGAAASGLLSGQLYEINPVAPLIFNASFTFIGFALAFLLKEPHSEESIGSSKHKGATFIDQLKTLKEQASSVLRLILLTSIFFSSTLLIVKLSQPIMEDTGFSIKVFGLQWALSMFASGLVSQFSHILKRFISIKSIIIISCAGPIFTLLLLSITSHKVFIFILLLLAPMFKSIGTIEIGTKLQHSVKDDFRVTISSLNNLFFRLVFLVSIPIVGFFSDQFSIQFALVICAILIVFLYLLLYFFNKLNQKSGSGAKTWSR